MGSQVLDAVATTRHVSVRAYAHCHATLGALNGSATVVIVNTAKVPVDVVLPAGARMHFLLLAPSPSSANISLSTSRGPVQLMVDAAGNLPRAIEEMDGEFHPGKKVARSSGSNGQEDETASGNSITVGPLSYGFVVLLDAKFSSCMA
jgi:hypothetical protein